MMNFLALLSALATPPCDKTFQTQIHTVPNEQFQSTSGSVAGKIVLVVFDTGTGISRTTKEFVKRAKLIPYSHVELNGVHGKQITYKAQVTIGNKDIGYAEIGTVSSFPFKSWGENTLILGIDSVRKYGLILDLKGDKLSLIDQNKCSLSPMIPDGVRVVRVQKEREEFLVKVDVGAEAVDALLDSGANHSALSEEAANRLGLKSRQTAGESTNGITRTPVSLINIPELKIADKVYYNYPLFVSSALNGRYSMIIGRDIMSDFIIGLSKFSSDPVIFKRR